MTRLLLSLLFIQLFTLSAYSQRAESAIKGTVLTRDGKPATAISIHIEGLPIGAVSNDNGEFFFKKIKAGRYILKLSSVGIEPQEKTVELKEGETAAVSFTINETASELGEVIVNAERKNKYARKSSESVARTPLKNLENPQVYATISAELIKDQVLVDYRDAFRNVPGVNSLEQVSNGRTSAIIRGFRTGNYLRNGMVASQLTAVDVSNLERIEVLKGPSGTLFGSSYISYGGVVNRITKKPFETAQTELAYTGGSFGLSRLSVDINAPVNDAKTALFRLNAVRHTNGSFQENGFQRNYFIAPSFSYKVNDKLTLSADMELSNNHGTNTGVGFYPNAKAYPNMKGYSELNKIYDRTFSSDDITSTLKGYTFFARAEYKINTQWSFNANYTYAGVDARDQLQFTPNLSSGDSISRTVQRYAHNYYNQTSQVNLNGDVVVAGIRNRILVGGDINQSVTKPTYIKNFIYDTVPMTGQVPYITRDKIDQRMSQISYSRAWKDKSYQYGLYASDVVNVTDRLIVMLAVRYDKVDVKGSTSLITGATTGAYSKGTFSPKAGVVYQVVKEKVSVFGNYLNGFNYSASTDKEGKLFAPERANQWEGGVKTDLLDGKLSATICYYNIEVSNKLRTNPNDVNFMIQDGTQVSKGTEVELISSPIAGLNIVTGYAYNKSKITKASTTTTGKIAGRAPAHIANAWVSYQQPKGKIKGLGLGFGVNYNSECFYDDANTFTIPAFVVLSSVLSYDMPKFRIAFRADNLGNVKYWGPWGNAQPPTNYSGSISFKF